MWFTLFLIGLFSSLFVNCDNVKPLLQEFIMAKNLEENQTIRIMCSLMKGESVQFEWYKDDKKLDETNKRKIKYSDDSSELVIKSLSIEDLGDYKCISKNEYGEDSQRIPLYFEVKPKWIKEPQDMMSTLSKEVILECDAKGYPSPITQWIKLSNNKKTTVKEFRSNIIKFKLAKETSGYYKCQSSNSIGSIEKIIKVGYHGR